MFAINNQPLTTDGQPLVSSLADFLSPSLWKGERINPDQPLSMFLHPAVPLFSLLVPVVRALVQCNTQHVQRTKKQPSVQKHHFLPQRILGRVQLLGGHWDVAPHVCCPDQKQRRISMVALQQRSLERLGQWHCDLGSHFLRF